MGDKFALWCYVQKLKKIWEYIVIPYPAAEHILALSEQKLTEQGSRQLVVSGIPEAGSGAVELLQLDGLATEDDAVVVRVLAWVLVGDCVASVAVVLVANLSVVVDAAAVV